MNTPLPGTRFLLLGVITAAVLFCGCEPPEPPKPSPPEVTVTLPVKKDVVDYADFTGTTEASEFMEVRARVQGFLKSVDFADGDMVKEGDLLFVIEPEPFRARLAEAQANLAQTEASLKLAEANLGRAKQLVEKKTISQEEFQSKWAQRDAAQAEIDGDKAAIDQAKINLGYTEMHAPFSGRVGRHLVDPGNLVGASENTLLTTIVKMQPMYAYFDVSERVILRHLQWRRENPKRKDSDQKARVYLGLADEAGYPHEGVLDFLDNRVDPATGTALVRGVFANKEDYLYPGLFVRIRIPLETQKDAVLVRERAIGTDLGGKYVLTVDDKNIVRQQHVELGQLFGELRVIDEGLGPEDRYIVSGLQRARPGLPVAPTTAKPEPIPPAEPVSQPASEPAAESESDAGVEGRRGEPAASRSPGE